MSEFDLPHRAIALTLCSHSGQLLGATPHALDWLDMQGWPQQLTPQVPTRLTRLWEEVRQARVNGRTAGTFDSERRRIWWHSSELLASTGASQWLVTLQTEADSEAAGDATQAALCMPTLVQLLPGAPYQFEMHPDGRARFPYASDAFRRLYDVDPSTLRQDSNFLLRHVHRDDLRRFLDSIVESMTTQGVWQMDYRVVLPGKPLRWLRGRAIPRRQHDGSTLWNGYLEDVTAEMQARQRALERETSFHTLFQANPHPMWLCTADTLEVIDANAAAAKRQQLSREELNGTRLTSLHPPEEHESLCRHIGTPSSRIWRHHLPTGELRLVELRTRQLALNGRHCLLVVATDVTEREQLLAALRHSEDRLAMALSASGAGIWDWDLTTGVALLSPNYWAMVEYEPDSVIADQAFLDRLLHPEDRDRAMEILQGCISGLTDTAVTEHRMITRSGRVLWVQAYAKVHGRGPSGQALRLVGTVRDTTAAKVAEAETAALSKQLRALSALRDRQLDDQRREFAIDLHDRVGPLLSSIKLAAGLAEMGDQNVRKRAINKIIDLVDGGIRQVRERSWQWHSPALAGGLDQALCALLDGYAEQHGFEVQGQMDTPPAWLQEAHTRELCGIVEQALCNIGRHASATRVCLTVAAEGDELTLMVQDNGRGFVPSLLTRDRHFGLFGMRERAHRIGAELHVLSAPGQGCTVVVRLDVSGKADATSPSD